MGTKETRFPSCPAKGALVFLHLPWSSFDQVTQLISNLQKSGAEVSNFFHNKITHLITSEQCIEMDKKEGVNPAQPSKFPSSRGALILSKRSGKKEKLSIFEQAQKFNIEIVLVEEMKFELIGKSEKNISSTGKTSPKRAKEIKTPGQVRKLKEPFLKVEDHSGNFRPLVLEMKEWPDAITMFSREENALEASMRKRKRRSNYCELCEDRFFDLKSHLISEKHVKNARDPTKWEAVDALISKMTTVEKWIEDKLKKPNE